MRKERILERFEELAYLNKGLTIECIDERINETHVFHAEGGLRQFVEKLDESDEPLHPVILIETMVDSVVVDCAIQYTSSYKETVYTFANNIRTAEGGTHLSGFRIGLTRAINNYLKNQAELIKKLKKHVAKLQLKA